MNRIKLSEITPKRILDGVIRRLYDLPDAYAWTFPKAQYKHNKSALTGLHNLHTGKRCFILANGPSLSGMNLSLLKNEYTIGMNRIYLLFEKISFLPNYYVCINELVLEQFAKEIADLKMPKFVNWNRRKLFSAQDKSMLYIKLSTALRDRFVSNICLPISSGGTVTYTALQIAYFMGFTTVILIGLDHSFEDKGTPNKVEVRKSETDANHFHPDYFPKGVKWQLPDLQRSEIAYHLAKATYQSDGRKIIDATVNGKCEVFEKRDYLSLF